MYIWWLPGMETMAHVPREPRKVSSTAALRTRNLWGTVPCKKVMASGVEESYRSSGCCVWLLWWQDVLAVAR